MTNLMRKITARRVTAGSALQVGIAAVTSATLAAGCAHAAPGHDEIDRLIASERAFCRLAQESSVRQAFLQYLSDDAVMLLPRPANGKQAYRARPESATGLRWEPSCARISAAGDLGYTFGPWEFRRDRNQDAPDAYGHFVSVWLRQADGQWRVVFDSGISHGRPEGPQDTLRRMPGRVADGGGILTPAACDSLAQQLKDIDQCLSDPGSPAGPQDRLLAAMSDDVTLFLESRFPISGRTAAGAALRSDTSTYRWQPAGAAVSASGDLGYVYGTAELRHRGKPAGELAYLRIWGKAPDGSWVVAVQKSNPVTE